MSDEEHHFDPFNMIIKFTFKQVMEEGQFFSVRLYVDAVRPDRKAEDG